MSSFLSSTQLMSEGDVDEFRGKFLDSQNKTKNNFEELVAYFESMYKEKALQQQELLKLKYEQLEQQYTQSQKLLEQLQRNYEEEKQRQEDVIEQRNREIRLLKNDVKRLESDLEAKEGKLKKEFEDTFQQRLEDEIKLERRKILQERTSLENNLALLSEKNSDLEEKLKQLIYTNEKLNKASIERMEKNEELRQKISELVRKQEEELGVREREYQEQINRLRDQDRSMHSGEMSKVRSIHETQLRQREERILEHQRSISSLHDEISSLQSDVNRRDTEIHELNERIKKLEVMREQDRQDMLRNVDFINNQVVKSDEEQVRLDIERSVYDQQIHNYVTLINDLEKQIEKLHNDNIRLQEVLNSQVTIVSQVKSQSREIELKLLKEIDTYKDQINTFKNSSYEINEILVKYSGDKASYEEETGLLKQVINNTKTELQKVYSLLTQRREALDEQLGENEEIRKTITSLEAENKHLKGQLQDKEQYIQFQTAQIDSLNRLKESYYDQAHRNFKDLQSRNKDLGDKINDVNRLNTNYEEKIKSCLSLYEELLDKAKNKIIQ